MKTAEIKSLLHERIEQLTASQLKQLNDLLNEKFPKKRRLGTMPGLTKDQQFDRYDIKIFW